MRYLIVGGTGFVGNDLVKYLSEKDNDIVVISRGISKYYIVKGVEYLHSDRRNLDEFYYPIKNRKFDVIIDLCCMNERDVSDPSKSNILYNKYIMISSISVYPLGIDLNEDSIIDKNKLTKYGIGKKEAEDKLIKVIDKKKLVIIRFPSFIGMGKNGEILKLYYDTVLQEKSEFVGNLNSTLSLISLEDVVKFIEWSSINKFNGIINACCDESIEIKKIINISEKITNKKRINHEWDSDSRIIEQTMLNDKAKALGFIFKNIEEVVSHYFETIKQ